MNTNDKPVPSSQPETPTEEDELHTGDDERLDCVANIRAAIEQMRGDREVGHDCTEVDDAIPSILEDCEKLNSLIIATIKRERSALPVVQDEAPKATEAADIKRWGKMLDYAQQHHGASASTAIEFLRSELSALGASRPSPADRCTVKYVGALGRCLLNVGHAGAHQHEIEGPSPAPKETT